MFDEIYNVLKNTAENRLKPEPERNEEKIPQSDLKTTLRLYPAILAQINFGLSELRGKYEPEVVKAIEKWLLSLETEAINYLAINGYFGPIKDNFSAIDQLRMAGMIQKTSVPFGLASWWNRSESKLHPEILVELGKLLHPRFPVQMVAKHSNNNDLSQPSDSLIEEFRDFLIGDFLDSEKDYLNYGIIGKIIEKLVKTNYSDNEIEQNDASQVLYTRLKDKGAQAKIRDELSKINQELKDFINQVDRTKPLAVQRISKVVSALSVYFMNQISCILLEGEDSYLKDLQDLTLVKTELIKKLSRKNQIVNLVETFLKRSKEPAESPAIFSPEEKTLLLSPYLKDSNINPKEVSDFTVKKPRQEGKDSTFIKLVADVINKELLEVGASPFFVPFFSVISIINPPVGLALSISAPLLNGPASTFGFLALIGYIAKKNKKFAQTIEGTELASDSYQAIQAVERYAKAKNYEEKQLAETAIRAILSVIKYVK